MPAEDLRFIPTPLPTTIVIYYQTNHDSDGQILDASNGQNYTITFPLPLPAQIFWSLTIYNSSSLLLFKNPINRYNIGDRVSFCTLLTCFSERAVAPMPGGRRLQLHISIVVSSVSVRRCLLVKKDNAAL